MLFKLGLGGKATVNLNFSISYLIFGLIFGIQGKVIFFVSGTIIIVVDIICSIFKVMNYLF